MHPHGFDAVLFQLRCSVVVFCSANILGNELRTDAKARDSAVSLLFDGFDI